MTTTSKNLIATLDEIIEEKSLLKHPFYQAWTAGGLSLADLQKYAAQYFHFEAAFPTFLSAIHSRCESPAQRQAILDNLWDEEHGKDNHVALWLRFCEGLGLTEAEVRASTPLPETRALIDGFRAACSQSTAVGVATMYAYESQAPAVAESKIAGLAKNYGMTDPRTISFFSVHAGLDIEHSDAERSIIEEGATDDAEVIAAVREATSLLNGFLDGAYAGSC